VSTLSPSIEERILVLAPSGSDAFNAVRALQHYGMHGAPCGDILRLCHAAAQGAGALLIAEEALAPDTLQPLVQLIEAQPSWSDIPIVVITSGGDTTQASLRMFTALAPSGNITLLERPFRVITLVSALQVALRARRRQYQVRTLLEQHQRDQAQLREHANELEKRVEERTAKLAETISELEAFSYSVSHDLRGPLRTMQGYSHYLIEDAGPALDATCRHYVERIASSAARLDALVQDILAYSRVARAEIRTESIDLAKLINDIIEQYPGFQRPLAEITLREPLQRVLGHEASLTQCISNLLGNAIKFVAPGVVPSIEIWTEPKQGKVRVWFKDNGIGIDPEMQPKIFKMFEKVHANGHYEGTGIGLAIVRKAVERMCGEVGVESRPGAGSKFWLELPKG
jgi:signal transduction histidine kinase